VDELSEQMVALLGMLAALATSGLFSGAETALFSLSRLDLRKLRDSARGVDRVLVRLRERPRRLLVTILLGNLVVNVAYFSLADAVAEALRRGGRFELGLAFAGGAIVTLILTAELLPKSLALRRPRRFARIVGLPLFVLQEAILPVRWVLSRITRVTSRLVGGPADGEEFLSPQELEWLVERGGEEGRLLASEIRMIREVLELGDIRVREVLTPRVDLVTFDVRRPREDLVALLAERPTSRVLVHDGNLDEVDGFVDGRDLLFRPEASVAELRRPLRIVPDAKPVEALLREMRKERFAAALVVDEYGGTEGLVTLEDLVEEIVGEIADEFEEEALDPVTILPDGRRRVRGHAPMRDLEELLGGDHEGEEVDTLGGFVAARLGRVARVGDVVVAGGRRLTVERVIGRRVRQVLVEVDTGEETP